MLNNELRLIGTITSEFVEVEGNVAFPKKRFTIEVEKKAKGKYCTFTVEVYGNNNLIDTETSLEGKAVIVNAYVDCYNNYNKIVAQEIFVVGVGKPRIKAVTPAPVVEEAPAEEEVVTKNLDELDLPDDDLPF